MEKQSLFYFQLGRNPNLSIAEILTYLSYIEIKYTILAVLFGCSLQHEIALFVFWFRHKLSIGQ